MSSVPKSEEQLRELMAKTVYCASCQFWQAFEESEEGLCYRYPPQVVYQSDKITFDPKGFQSRGDMVNEPRLPRTFNDHWCGEWKGKGQ